MAKEGIGQVISWYICTVAAVLFLVARLSTRYQRLRLLGTDDGLITLAACCLIGDLIIQQYMWNLGMAEIPKASREEFIQIMKVIDIAARHHGPHSLMRNKDGCPWIDSICHIIMGSQNRHDKCDPRQEDINYWLTVLFNIVTDVIIISLPISMVLKLQMKLKLKLGVIAIFALGFFVVIASSPASSVGTKSNRGHYELSSGGHHRSWRTDRGRNTTDVMGGTRNKDNSSEDNLVNDLGAPVASEGASTNGKNGEIKVNTTFQVHYGRNEEAGHHSTKHNQF
ncbi:hypothetical protein MAC_00172 [Metarhizium acridum CQMa 102]|uniref:Rhodopsin domain-containing protein n=1 Tax=Metarhizium acridum (strain CQMa 102) TaxID=655827 RepID=E9DR03_METAQ|nr:uncharacterized protein MAC_00172 [Metarhizium acridum CQMa 102]EFY93681.1 hypothetical protein MAC_00172 [Metarhizium acridum CQMa 102]